MASFAELLQQSKVASPGSSLSTAAATDESTISSCCSSRSDLLEAASLVSLTAENRSRTAVLRQRLSERTPEATVRKQEVQKYIAENELKIAALQQRILNRPSLAAFQPLPQIEPSFADLRSANELKTAELRYLMASRRLQTLVDTGMPQAAQ